MYNIIASDIGLKPIKPVFLSNQLIPPGKLGYP